MSLRIDTEILREQLGIEVIDNNDGYLSEGDFFVSRTAEGVERYEVQSADIYVDENLKSLFDRFLPEGVEVSIIYRGGRSYLAAAHQERSFLRIYEINTKRDEVILSEGQGIEYAQPKKISSGHGLGGVGPGSRGSFGLDHSFDFGQPADQYTLARTICDDKPQTEQYECHKEIVDQQELAQEKAQLRKERDAIVQEIRESILDGGLALYLIKDLQRINKQIEKLDR